MSIFKELFESNSDRNRNLKEVSNLISTISLSIITASDNCTKATLSLFDSKNDKEKHELHFYVFYEFIYFFLHLTLRESSSKLTSLQLQKLQNHLGSKVDQTIIDIYFKHWPEDMKSGISSGFYKNLNKAEIEYSKLKKLLGKNPFSSDSLFSKLAQNVAELCDSSMNPATISYVMYTSLDEFENLKLTQLIDTARYVL